MRLCAPPERPRHARRVALLAWLCLAAGRDSCAAPWEGWDFSYNAAFAAHYATGSASLDDEENLVGGTLFGNATLERDTLTAFAESQVQMTHFGDTPRRDHLLRQAYFDYSGERFDLRLGRQLLVWGRADRFNPTDNLTPADFNFLTIDDQGHRFGAVGATFRYLIGEDYSVVGVVLPLFEASELPRGILPGGIATEEDPAVGFDQPQLGFKIERSGTGFDASLSYYRGYSTSPAVAVTAARQLALIHPEIEVIGGDFAVTYGGWGFRGEAAYRSFREQGRFVPGTEPRSSLYAVLGIERGFGEGNQWLVQWLHRRLESFTAAERLAPPLNRVAFGNDAIFSQFDRIQNGLSASVITRWRDETVTAELAGAVFFEHGDFVLRPKLIWSLSDHWRLAGVVDWFVGPRDSNFGVLEDNTRLFVELRRSF